MKTALSAPNVGWPVNPVLGAKILAGDEDLDLTLEGLLPFEWQRTYRSTNARKGWFGRGWGSPLEVCLESVAAPGGQVVDHIDFIDTFGRRVKFPELEPDGESFSAQERMSLVRTVEGQYRIRGVDGTSWWFGERAGAVRRLVAVVDRNGNTIRLDYREAPAALQAVCVTCSGGQNLELAFEAARLVQITELRGPPGAVVRVVLMRYEYTDAGELCRVVNRAGECLRAFEYDKQSRMIRQVYAGTFESGYEYEGDDPDARVARHWDNTGRAWRFRYADDHTAVTDQDDRVSLFHFDAERRWTGYTDPRGRCTQRGLDRAGNVRAVIDPRGRATEVIYDERGNPVEFHDAADAVTTIAWHPTLALPVSVTDPLNRTTLYEYDARGNLLVETDPTGAQTQYFPDDRGLATRIVDANGGAKQLVYNECGQITRYVDCSGRATDYAYDADGRLVEVVNALGEKTTYDYDQAGRLCKEALADGSFLAYENDLVGRTVATTNALQQRTEFRYFGDGQLASETNPLGHRIEYRYDRARRLVEIINENGASHAFEYDRADRLVGERRFDGVRLRHRYDEGGYLVESVEAADTPQAIVTAYLRDATGRIIDRRTDATHSEFGYDPAGQLVWATNRHSQVRLNFEYDGAGRAVAETITVANRQFVLKREYDPLGNCLSSTLPTGQQVQTLYYGSGHAHRVQIDGKMVADFERDALHREVRRTQGRLASSRHYDAAGRLLRQTVGPAEPDSLRSPKEYALVQRQYQYDLAGRVVGIAGPNGRVSVGYDAVDRLERFRAENFAFDPAHNPVPTAEGIATTSGGRVEGNRLTVFEDKRFAYDAHGRLIEKRVGSHTVVALRWDEQHCMVGSITNSPRGTVATQYLYDPLGRRIAKRRGDETVWFMWDGDLLVGELTENELSLFVYEPDSFVPLALVKEVVGDREKVRRLFHYHCDQVGLPQELTDAEGQLRWREGFKAWGRRLDRVESADLAVLDEPPVSQPLRFQGQYLDEDTGLHYNRHRYYDPDVGRFISQDPIGLTGGTNPYQYAPNPLSWIDPWGLAVVEATFKMSGRRYTGRNPTDRARRSRGKTPKGMRGPNTDRCDMHAEIEAMMKAYDKGLRGGEATLTISGLPACPYCTGDVKTMARKLKLDKLTVNNNGQTIAFTKEDLKPIKDGGKGWKCG